MGPLDRGARRTKIIATLGPATSGRKAVERLARAGADVFRLNMSHGTRSDHEERVNSIRAAEQDCGRPLGILLDLQGPKLRLGVFRGGRVEVVRGQGFRLDLNTDPGDHNRVRLPHPEIFAALRPGHQLLVDDGRVRLQVEAIGEAHADTTVLVGGTLSDRKGVNVPSATLPILALTDKDLNDLAFGLEAGVDWVALSFVQTPDDVARLKERVGERAGIVAKLEKPAALRHLREIVNLADAVMVARGDLGVELAPEDVPVEQRRILRECRRRGKPVIVATQMLESMIASPTPTRAEASDVASAVYDGVDAVMLSGETASGSYAPESVQMMERIIRRVESDPLQRQMIDAIRIQHAAAAADAIGSAVRAVCQVMPVSAIASYTSSGTTALRTATERPEAPIVALSPLLATARRLALVWGVRAVCVRDAENVEDMVEKARAACVRLGLYSPGRAIVVVAGIPFGVPGSTNLMRLVCDQPDGARHASDPPAPTP